MKNKVDDLRDHLFAELERLGDENLEGEKLDRELKRAKAIKDVADSIINSAKAETDRVRVVADTGFRAGTALLGRAEQSVLESPPDKGSKS